MRISIFPTVSATSIEALDVTWAQFAQHCVNPPKYPSKATCPLVKLATFGAIPTAKGALRHEANMLSISGIEADYDGELVSPEDARDLLTFNGIESVIYTSPSHTAKTPRWRVLAPITDNAPLEQRRALVGRLNAALGGILAAESFTTAQSFYIGAVAGTEYVCYLTHGATIDTLTHLEPLYPVKAAPAPTSATFADRTASRETIAELQSAMLCLDANDYETWIAVGNACKTLGDEEGFPIWDKWSAISPKYEPARWNTFNPERTGFAAMFARAARNGWVNPKSGGAPVDTAAIFAVLATTPPSEFKPTVCSEIRLTSAEQQVELFKDCVYIASTRQMLIPDAPYLVDKARFDEWQPVAGRSFMVSQTNQGAPEKSAWQAYLQSQIISWPRASTWCFRPECPPNAVIEEDGESMVNIWREIKTKRTPGDATLFAHHIKKLLPIERDAEIFLSYLAGMVQYPGSKFRYCFVLQGAKGNGKSFFGSCISKALSDRYVHYPNSADITNKFNAWMAGKLAVIVEEICTQDKRETLEILKPMITNPRIELQGKGVNQVTGDNRANFLMFVNEQGSLPQSDDERRYCTAHAAQQSYEDIVRDGMDEGDKYFQRLWNWANNGGFEIISHFLATYPIPDEFNPSLLTRAPRTSSFAEAVSASQGRLATDVIEAIENGREGFRGDWIGSHMLDAYLREIGRDRYVTRNSKRDMLVELGYVTHPSLFQGGRTSNPLKGTNPPVRPVLYLKKGHAAFAIHKPALVLEAYLDAQREVLREVFAA